jgi:hypothetical protein
MSTAGFAMVYREQNLANKLCIYTSLACIGTLPEPLSPVRFKVIYTGLVTQIFMDV